MNKKKKGKGLYSKILVAFVVAQVLIYTYVNMYLSYKVSIEISPTLTTCFFAFFGLEAGILGMIKNTKTKSGDNNDRHYDNNSDRDYVGFDDYDYNSDSVHKNEDYQRENGENINSY